MVNVVIASMDQSASLHSLADSPEEERAEREMERLLLNQGSDIYLNVYDMVCSSQALNVYIY